MIFLILGIQTKEINYPENLIAFLNEDYSITYIINKCYYSEKQAIKIVKMKAFCK